MYSCAMRSSSSVVTPGVTALPASASAPAAMRPATRIFSITSGVCTHGSLPSFAVGFHAYSGRGIDDGTGRVGDCTPERRADRTGMTTSLTGRQGAQPGEPLPPRPADAHRTHHHAAGEHHVRLAFGRRVLA